MDIAGLITLVLVAVIVAAVVFRSLMRPEVVIQYQRAIRYRHGKFLDVLEPGRHWLRFSDKITKVDVREQYVTVPGQEVLTADGASVRLTVTLAFKIVNPARVVNEIEEYQGALYSVLQAAIRLAVGSRKLDEFLEQRDDFDAVISAKVSEGVSKLGLELLGANVRDIMLAGEVKRALTQVLTAHKEGLAKLESARGEVAALRALANAAHMVNDNPSLLQLRVVEAIAKSSGNTVVFNPADLRLKPKGTTVSKPADRNQG